MSAEPAVWCCSNCGAVYHKDYPRCPFDGGEVVLATSDPLLGQRIGNYVIDALIGEGGMGRVYAAHHANLTAKRYAIKVLLGDVAASSSMRERFTREAEAASRLEHPNVVNILDFGAMPSGLPYIVMDYIDGVSLTSLMDKPMDPARVIRLARAVADGLGYAHARGVVHRDLKPDNVMIVTTPDGAEVPRIADFGLATTVETEHARLTSTGMAMGTPAYAAPEQMAGRRVDQRADIYALGMTMFEMLTGGTLPFEGHPMETAAAKAHRDAPRILDISPGLELPPGLEDLVMHMIRRFAAERPDTAKAVIAALDKIVLASAVDERAATVAEPSRPAEAFALPRRKVPVGVVLAACGALAGGVAWWLQRGGDAPVADAKVVATKPPPPPVAPPPPPAPPPAPEPAKPVAEPPAVVDTPPPPPAKPTHKPAPVHHDVPAQAKRVEPARHADPPKPVAEPPVEIHKPVNGTPVDPPPPPPPKPVTIVSQLAGLDVHGSLSQQDVSRAVGRVLGAIKGCTPDKPGTVTVRFSIDESRRARNVRTSPNNACVANAFAGVRTEAAPDVGDADVEVQIAFVAK